MYQRVSDTLFAARPVTPARLVRRTPTIDGTMPGCPGFVSITRVRVAFRSCGATRSCSRGATSPTGGSPGLSGSWARRIWRAARRCGSRRVRRSTRGGCAWQSHARFWMRTDECSGSSIHCRHGGRHRFEGPPVYSKRARVRCGRSVPGTSCGRCLRTDIAWVCRRDEAKYNEKSRSQRKCAHAEGGRFSSLGPLRRCIG